MLDTRLLNNPEFTNQIPKKSLLIFKSHTLGAIRRRR